MLTQRRRRWANIEPILDERFVFAGQQLNIPIYNIYKF